VGWFGVPSLDRKPSVQRAAIAAGSFAAPSAAASAWQTGAGASCRPLMLRKGSDRDASRAPEQGW